MSASGRFLPVAPCAVVVAPARAIMTLGRGALLENRTLTPASGLPSPGANHPGHDDIALRVGSHGEHMLARFGEAPLPVEGDGAGIVFPHAEPDLIGVGGLCQGDWCGHEIRRHALTVPR